jgi:hypothetical protein
LTTVRGLIVAATLFSVSIAFAQIRSAQDSPYTATEKTTVVQTLSDGTHIKTENIVFMARDSSGRTFRKSELPFGSDPPIMQSSIADPVSRTNIIWTSNTRQATRIHMLELPPRPQAGFSALGSGSTVATVSGSAGVLGTFSTSSAFTSAAPAGANMNSRRRPEHHTEKLGTQSIAGVLAEGTRTTITYPIGFVGNDRPIESVNETWTSPDLHIVIRATSTDPRMGTRTTEVISLDRAEPDPSVFLLPQGYEIKDQQR